MDRKTGSDLFLHTNAYGFLFGFNNDFIKVVLDSDSRAKGVRITSKIVTRQGIDAVVEWLK